MTWGGRGLLRGVVPLHLPGRDITREGDAHTGERKGAFVFPLERERTLAGRQLSFDFSIGGEERL